MEVIVFQACLQHMEKVGALRNEEPSPYPGCVTHDTIERTFFSEQNIRLISS